MKLDDDYSKSKQKISQLIQLPITYGLKLLVGKIPKNKTYFGGEAIYEMYRR